MDSQLMPPKLEQLLSHKYTKVAILLLILGLALVVRLENYYGMVRSDDFKYAAAAYELSQGNALNLQYCCGLDRYGITLPVAAFYSIFGISEFTAILFPLLMSLVAVLFVYGIGFLLASEAVAIIAALLWTIFPLNVFLATQLLPDGIIASLTTGAVFFLLLGDRLKWPWPLLPYLAAMLLLIWAFFVKEASLTVAIFFVTYLVYKILVQLDKILVKKWPSKRTVIRRVGISSIVLFGGILFFSLVRFPKGNAIQLLAITATDMLESFLFGRSPFDLEVPREQIADMWIIWVPFVFAALLFKRDKSVFPLIGWFGVMFFVSEWGMEVKLSYGLPLLYSPPQLWLGARHFLLFWPPLIIMIAIFIGDELERNLMRFLAVSFSIPLIVFTGLFHERIFLQDTHFYRVVYLIALIAPLVLFLFHKDLHGRGKQISGAAVFGLLLIATLRPTPNYNLEDWKYYQQLHINIRQASLYLLDQDTQYPIYTLDHTHSLLLNFHSDFQLGYNWEGAIENYPDARIMNSIELMEENRNAYLMVLANGQYGSAGSTWWPVALFGTGSGEGSTVTVFRQLSSLTAQETLQDAKEMVEASPTVDHYSQLLAAAVNAEELQTAIDSWNQLRIMGDESASINYFLSAVRSFYIENPESRSENLLDISTNSSDWHINEFVTIEIIQDIEKNTELVINVTRNTDRELGLFRQLFLDPSSLYLFQAEVRSSMPVNIIKLEDGEIPDSSSSLTQFEEWQTVQVIFITPLQNELVSPTKLALMVTNAVGEVQIKNPQLVKLLLE